MGLVLKAEGQAERCVMGLQKRISVLSLVQCGHRSVQLLKAILRVLDESVFVGEVSTYNPRYRQVVPQICALHSKSTICHTQKKDQSITDEKKSLLEQI